PARIDFGKLLRASTQPLLVATSSLEYIAIPPVLRLSIEAYFSPPKCAQESEAFHAAKYFRVCGSFRSGPACVRHFDFRGDGSSQLAGAVEYPAVPYADQPGACCAHAQWQSIGGLRFG